MPAMTVAGCIPTPTLEAEIGEARTPGGCRPVARTTGSACYLAGVDRDVAFVVGRDPGNPPATFGPDLPPLQRFTL